MCSVSLLDVEPDLGNWLSDDELVLARRLMVPTALLGPGSPELDRVLEEADAFGALLLDGIVMHRMMVAGRRILRLLGPGDIIVHTWAPRSQILGHSSKLAAEPTQIALLGHELVNAARQFPGLIVGLHLRLGDQHQRLAVQLGICQLPRVQERVLALMWLLAESWGTVTPSGTRLPVKLTHATIGEMIGARRPTVSLALRDLGKHGSLRVQDDGWVLLADPPVGTSSASSGAESATFDTA
jgi:CRP/FNR family transcriptional regulator, cyclic AMP receptor protein